MALNLVLAIVFALAFIRSDPDQEGYIAWQDRMVSESLRASHGQVYPESLRDKILALDPESAQADRARR